MAIHENEKISDNILKNRITLSIISILFCLTVMISSAFAFFNCNLKQEFTMRAAKWEILVEDANGNIVGPGYTCPPGVADEIHEFTISSIGTAEKGYCIINITNAANETETYYTNSFDDSITVKIQAIAGTKVQFAPYWGSPVNYGVRSVSMGTIYHSFTPPPPEETLGEGSSDNGDKSSSTGQSESGETSTESSDNKSANDTSSSNEGESAASESESSSASNESTSHSVSESSSSPSESSPFASSESSSASSSAFSTNSGSSSSESSSAPVSSSEGSTTSSGGESSSASSAGGEE